jgi:uncharacterized protein
MKINIDQISEQGLTFKEEVSPASLELDTEIARLLGPIQIKVEVSKITNVVIADLDLSAGLSLVCSRCLSEFNADFKRQLKLHYSVDKGQREIDLNPEIREDIILEYPIKPLCKPDCRGLCPGCGKNLNDGKCQCSK